MPEGTPGLYMDLQPWGSIPNLSANQQCHYYWDFTPTLQEIKEQQEITWNGNSSDGDLAAKEK